MSDATETDDGAKESPEHTVPREKQKDVPPPQPAGAGGGDGKHGGGTGDGGGAPKPTPWVVTVLAGLASLMVAAAFVGILASIFLPYIRIMPTSLDKTLLLQLSDTETARGLITFLVAVSTVAIAVILIVYLASSAAGGEVIKERFAFSKEVLTSLIGILGTIIGFYFGATQNQPHGQGTPTPLTLAKLSIIPDKPGKGDKVTLHATLSGGQPPYHYVIRFTPDTIAKTEGDSPDGTVSREINFDDYDPATRLDITLEGTDATEAISGKQLHLPAAPSPSTQSPSANKTH